MDSALVGFARARSTPSATAGRLEVAGLLCTAYHCVTGDDNDTTVFTTTTTTNGDQRTINRGVVGGRHHGTLPSWGRSPGSTTQHSGQSATCTKGHPRRRTTISALGLWSQRLNGPTSGRIVDAGEG